MASEGLNDIVINRVIDTIQKKGATDIKILDLGSGQGYNAACLSEKLKSLKISFTITCVDIDEQHFKLNGTPGILFIKHDLNKDLPVETFDIVIGTEIIEHIENPYHFLRMCLSHLSPHGICYITTPNPEHAFSLIKQFVLGRPMWFSVDEPSGHIMPIHMFMISEALQRIKRDTGINYQIERTFNRNCFPLWIKSGRLILTTLPGKNRNFGEINIFKITSV